MKTDAAEENSVVENNERENRITLTKEDLTAIDLIRVTGESDADVIRRALQESLEYGILKQVLNIIDGRLDDLLRQVKGDSSYMAALTTQMNSSAIPVPEELRKKEKEVDRKEIENLKKKLEGKWSEVGDFVIK
jgi:hypothetical protein